MGSHTVLMWVIIGSIAGWLADVVLRGDGFGAMGGIVVGILGACAAGYLLPRVGIPLGYGMMRAVVDAFVGAVMLLAIVRGAGTALRIATSFA